MTWPWMGQGSMEVQGCIFQSALGRHPLSQCRMNHLWRWKASPSKLVKDKCVCSLARLLERNWELGCETLNWVSHPWALPTLWYLDFLYLSEIKVNTQQNAGLPQRWNIAQLTGRQKLAEKGEELFSPLCVFVLQCFKRTISWISFLALIRFSD